MLGSFGEGRRPIALRLQPGSAQPEAILISCGSLWSLGRVFCLLLACEVPPRGGFASLAGCSTCKVHSVQSSPWQLACPVARSWQDLIRTGVVSWP